MKLSVSNIAWKKEFDQEMYQFLRNKYIDLEIAPTRIFEMNPYDCLVEACAWAKELQNSGVNVVSIQSIWFNQKEHLFGTELERQYLLEYTKKAILFSKSVGAKNLVFGCPKNRNYEDGTDITVAVPFFREIGDFAKEQGIVIGMEANPKIYNTNYINTTKEAIELVKQVDSEGFLLNLDVGTMIAEDEDISVLYDHEHLINHVHISEPGLLYVKERNLHKKLADLLKKAKYQKYISLEVQTQDSIKSVQRMLEYMIETFD